MRIPIKFESLAEPLVILLHTEKLYDNRRNLLDYFLQNKAVLKEIIAQLKKFIEDFNKSLAGRPSPSNNEARMEIEPENPENSNNLSEDLKVVEGIKTKLENILISQEMDLDLGTRAIESFETELSREECYLMTQSIQFFSAEKPEKQKIENDKKRKLSLEIVEEKQSKRIKISIDFQKPIDRDFFVSQFLSEKFNLSLQNPLILEFDFQLGIDNLNFKKIHEDKDLETSIMDLSNEIHSNFRNYFQKHKFKFFCSKHFVPKIYYCKICKTYICPREVSSTCGKSHPQEIMSIQKREETLRDGIMTQKSLLEHFAVEIMKENENIFNKTAELREKLLPLQFLPQQISAFQQKIDEFFQNDEKMDIDEEIEDNHEISVQKLLKILEMQKIIEETEDFCSFLQKLRESPQNEKEILIKQNFSPKELRILKPEMSVEALELNISIEQLQKTVSDTIKLRNDAQTALSSLESNSRMIQSSIDQLIQKKLTAEHQLALGLEMKPKLEREVKELDVQVKEAQKLYDDLKLQRANNTSLNQQLLLQNQQSSAIAKRLAQETLVLRNEVGVEETTMVNLWTGNDELRREIVVYRGAAGASSLRTPALTLRKGIELSTILNDSHFFQLNVWISETFNFEKKHWAMAFKGPQVQLFYGLVFLKRHIFNREVPVLLVMKSDNESLFGAVITKNMDDQVWIEDDKAFLFSLYNAKQPSRSPMRFKCVDPKKAVFGDILARENPMLQFGTEIVVPGGGDGRIEGCTSNFGTAYGENLQFSPGSEEAKSFLCGGSPFAIEQIEAYLLL